MKKFKVFVAFVALMFLMSSCIYSLFPIYTAETKVFLPELEGKWLMDNDSETYMIISGGLEADGKISFLNNTPFDGNQSVGNQPKVETSFSIEFDDDEYIILEGDTIRDRDKIQSYYDKELAGLSNEFASKMGDALKRIGSAVKGMGKTGSFDFGVGKDSYLLTWVEGDDRQTYEAVLTNIGGDFFLDLYAADGDLAEQNVASQVWFPVHTFMKLELNADQLKLTQFDYDKMNKLFESNLVRLRHENVDGSILITAQTNELRKFIDKYSDDERVFEGTETYTRVEE